MRTLAIRAVLQEFPDGEVNQASDLGSLERVLHQHAPDILVTDLDLRWTDGFAVFDRVKAANPQCCAVMFTGTGNEELAVRAIRHGFDDYVVKGTHQLRRLATAVRAAYERNQELRRQSENRELVLKELYHRLHNNLQMVISLLRMTEKTLESPRDRDQLADLGRRIQALSALQAEFYQSEDFRRVNVAGFLDRLARNLVGLTGGRVTLSCDLEETEMPVDVAVPFGLMANEIMTNALKHAFPGGRTGHLSVRLARTEGRLDLTIGDNVLCEGVAAALGRQISARRLA
ncbi:histidine kinase dimerization/phosphoacceptor domain -containing protein [Microvirga yunnanensis]|uniref:histidine kinase dimerization/phosphoacceptor domain -containing protein n=1 Tax=Microvirga yunnanensis TaxID=2953740 RepID=UPI0021C7C47B|nr:histidine kinase dimerization/phosphoacceptor domain -containing protein [Microvirga sp. HBU65207]